MRFLSLILFCCLLASPADAQDRSAADPDAWRLTRDEDGVVRLSRKDRKDALEAAVALGGTPKGFLLDHHDGIWWLYLAGPDLIVAGRSKKVGGPYLDHRGRNLVDRGGTIVIAGLPRDDNRLLLRRTPGGKADRLETSDGVHPLVWPTKHAYPVAGPVGTIDSWEKPVEVRWPFAGPWRHSGDFGPVGVATPTADGSVAGHPPGSHWRIEGDVLTMVWPRRGAPDGAWTDRCRISADGRYYLGRNQWQATISGEIVASEAYIQPNSRMLPAALLPKNAVAPAGKLSLWADFEHARDGIVPLFVVNRTKEAVRLPAQDGDIYAKLFSRTESGEWERSQSHVYSWCGNSYFFEPSIPPGHFLVTHGEYPEEGEERAVRYRIVSEVAIVSNEGRGRVSPRTVAACRTDRMALRTAGFMTLSEVALGEVKPLAHDRTDLRAFAVEQLAKRFPDDPRTERILRQLRSDPNPRVAGAALKSLK